MHKLALVQPLDAAYLLYPAQSSSVTLPFFEVAAGYPSAAQDYLEQELDINEFMLGSRRASIFLFRIVGMSMRDAGIVSSDIIIVDRALEAQDGDIVVAELDGNYTCKYLRKTKRGIWLEPANPDFKPIKIDGEQELKIFGVMDGLIRKGKNRNSKQFITPAIGD
jgi:DNA polymerase V